jgi:formate hydrogenlyase transcriptional activator
VDPDLNYSEPASVKLEVVPDPTLEAYKEAASRLGARGEFVGDSAAAQALLEQLHTVAASEVTVLILGETGTGKGLAAKYVHFQSRRQEGPFTTVDCAAITQGLEESKLFGHEKGAFTGAVQQRMGSVGMAQGGTLFFDEVGELPLPVQTKLLRLLQDHEYERVGGSGVLVSNARIIAATNRDLEAMVREGTFRADLYYRLKVYEVHLPPLRERKADIPQLAAHFLEAVVGHLGRKIRLLSPAILEKLRAYEWPGNVRELQHVVERAVVACKGSEIQMGDIALEGRSKVEADGHHQNGNGRVYLLEEIERRHIQAVLEEVGWVIRGEHGAAALLGLPESSLRDRIKKLGIVRPVKGKAS